MMSSVKEVIYTVFVLYWASASGVFFFFNDSLCGWKVKKFSISDLKSSSGYNCLPVHSGCVCESETLIYSRPTGSSSYQK